MRFIFLILMFLGLCIQAEYKLRVGHAQTPEQAKVEIDGLKKSVTTLAQWETRKKPLLREYCEEPNSQRFRKKLLSNPFITTKELTKATR